MALTQLFPELAPEERDRFRLIAAGFVFVAGAALVARVTGDALFLSRYGAEFLPYVYIGSALVLMIASLAFGAAARHFSPTRMALAASAALCAATLLLRLGLASDLAIWRLCAYFLADLVVNLPMMLFWGLAALVFNPREGKRLFGMVGASGTATCIVAGAVLRPAAARFGTENLLFAVALLLAGFFAVVLLLSRREAHRFQIPVRGAATAAAPHPSAARLGYWASLLRQPQIRNLAALVMLGTLAIVLVDYQFKSAARARYTGPALAGFIGTFYSGANLVTLVVQLFLVHRILKGGGVLVGLGVLPASLLATAVGTVASGAAFPWLMASRLMDPVFNFTINSAALQLLFLGIKKQTRSQARAFVDGTCKPLAIAMGGTALVGLSGSVTLPRVGAAVAVIAGLWLIAAWRNHKAYIAGLIDAVGVHRFELSADDVAVRDRELEAYIKQSLLSASDEDLPYLIGVLPQLGGIDASRELETLLERENPEVKVSALEYLRHRRNETSLAAILRHAEHPKAEVRAAAVHAAASWKTSAVLEALERRLDDESTTVRAAAAAELINSGDLDALLAAGVALKAMLLSEEASARIAATAALGDIRHGELSRLLAVLLRDPESDVLRVALEATAAHPNPELLPLVLPLLAEPQVGATAAETLVAFGAAALPALEAWFDPAATGTGAAGMQRIPAVVARIGDVRGLALLERAFGSPVAQLDEEAIAAWCQLVGRQSSLKPHLPALDRAVAREITTAAELRERLERLANLGGAEILSRALEDDYRSHIKNVFVLLDARTPAVDMSSVYFGLTRGTSEARAEALELLDNVVAAESKSRLLGLLEPPQRRTALTADAAESQLLALLDSSSSEWVRIGALHAAGENRLLAAGERVRQALGDPNPIVRETALHALSCLLARTDTVACALRMSDDPDARVRRLAADLLAA